MLDRIIETVDGATRRGFDRLVSLQRADGSWEAEVIWSPVITAQAVIVQAIVGRPADPERHELILRYFSRNRRPDGGWGLHPEAQSYVFVTTLVYIAARLLGAPAHEPMLVEAREVLGRQNGGVLANPQWGRFWLALVGLYDWSDLNACPPELFLLPRGSALSPLSFYCHTRYIYLAMSYLSGRRFKADLGPVLADIRRELPGLSLRGSDLHAWPAAPSDLHESPGQALKVSYATTRLLGPLWRSLPVAAGLRRRALQAAVNLIRHELQASAYQSLSPVSGLLDVLVLFDNDPNDPEVVAALEGAEFWCWNDPDEGLRYAGARSISWDTSFALQTLAAAPSPASQDHADAMRRGYQALRGMQASIDPLDRVAQARDINLGGWSFTDGAQGWPVSDCTAEAVLALLDCHAIPGLIATEHRISPQRLADAATFILSRQNEDGGFGSYERRRGARFLENLNPSEMFGRCMTELTYVECTASSIRALQRILSTDAPVDRARLDEAVRRGTAIILARQTPDGSWPGFWGINFVYGTLFALKALRAIGLAADHPAITRARAWLESKQKVDGGWGEHFSGCTTGRYVDNPESLVISTAWATLALTEAGVATAESAQRGARWLLQNQQPDGDWPRDSVNGVFFGTAMLDYRLYNTYFPALALAKVGTHAGA